MLEILWQVSLCGCKDDEELARLPECLLPEPLTEGEDAYDSSNEEKKTYLRIISQLIDQDFSMLVVPEIDLSGVKENPESRPEQERQI